MDLVPEEAIAALTLKVNPWISWESANGDDCGAPLDHLLEHEGGWGAVLEHYPEVRRIVAELTAGVAAELDRFADEIEAVADPVGDMWLKAEAAGRREVKHALRARASVLRGEGDPK